ncbi:iron siderophore-binding protein [Cytobacillus firmus]|uniref:ABC transporter substrate-binding protein n=1 Tax=Cytobacillus firmus TaxID=1399 RepID=UPI00077CAB6B|nr:iron-siderophore ABC transporter substrate-binding protein [Cytobacillus firmus]MBG9545340.1 iron siderophore-binding protein [Cytobacillus firmus]MBG9547730.1 iron siderophore-binding protein [Cytobacillus firmus]MBG9554434.1 iron siderophore-binding protein [Cytobacillus firmus]MBG9555423.1 iron siderophore-binding protein [Cytobacillus firmus]MBG9577143.1 iron siderophore-binding protein [Cytobacillus firmus]
MKFKYLLAILSVFTILFLAACGNSSEQDEKADKEKEGTKSEDTSYTVVHAMGTTKLDKAPEKVVILTNEGTEALLSLGVTPVGAVQSWTGNPWYDHIADDMKDVQVVGTESEVNVEAIAALQPDLIIGNKMRQEKIYDQLNDIAPTVFAETLRGDWKENFELYAKALNKEGEGKKVLADYDSRIEEIKTSLGDKLNQEVSIVRFMNGDVRIYHKDSFSGVILDQIGLARPESQNVDDFAEVNATKERIPAMDGDVLFYFTYETGDGEANKLAKEWIEDPLFKNLKVAQEGNVHEVSDTIWNTAGGVIAANLLLDDIEKYLVK